MTKYPVYVTLFQKCQSSGCVQRSKLFGSGQKTCSKKLNFKNLDPYVRIAQRTHVKYSHVTSFISRIHKKIQIFGYAQGIRLFKLYCNQEIEKVARFLKLNEVERNLNQL